MRRARRFSTLDRHLFDRLDAGREGLETARTADGRRRTLSETQDRVSRASCRRTVERRPGVRLRLEAVESSTLEVGRQYAYREKRSPGTPLLKVTVLEKLTRPGKLKVRFEDGPHPGLEDYASSRQIVVPWGQRKALLRDEERASKLQEYAGTFSGKALAEAASAVLESSGEPGAYVDGAVSGLPEEELQRLIDRAGLDVAPDEIHGLAYTDRIGTVRAPLEAMVGLAKAFAAAEPHTVVAYLNDREEELRLKGNQPGDRWYHDYLRELSPGYALARQWAGLAEESEILRKEIARLRGLLSTAAYDLRHAGEERKGNRLIRAIEGR